MIDYINEIEDPDYIDRAFAAHLRKEFIYILFIVTTGNTQPDTFFAYNYRKGSWTIGELADQVTAWSYYGDDVVFGDSNGDVFQMDFTDTDDDGTEIEAYIETKDFDFEIAVRILQTVLTSESNSGVIQIKCSTDFGNSWSKPVVVNQDTTDDIYDHIKSWSLRGQYARFKIENNR